ncbi:RNA polymerase sigma factor [Candidatus Uabimicrobium amorphum]|uniref:RNA polymerase sigma factor n=1 Tax=Uabimicrobium amorphum TaxID=2596890 RepID=A0A5S9F1V7_UABAM|nr:RNA polymerase sigma factor [Candidatus Uabimicrobium amorphum]BBM83017.1 RNA polymerase sigma factor [Candidatus Uabimicrobium amorphum]
MDDWLIELAVLGDEDAFAKLVEKHHRFVLGVAYQFLKNPQDAEDVAQDTFVKLYNFLPRYKKQGKFQKFLYRLVINECISFSRKKNVRKSTSLEADVASTEKFPDEICEGKELQEILSSAAQQLPEKQKQAFLLKTYGDYSYEEMGEILGCSETSVGALIFRARKALSSKLRSILK